MDATLDAIATGDLLSRFAGDRGLGRPGPAYLRRRSDWHWAEVAADGRAIHVGDLDLFRRRVQVHASLADVNGRLLIGPTKTYETRSVPIPAGLLDELVSTSRDVT